MASVSSLMIRSSLSGQEEMQDFSLRKTKMVMQ
nr:MAG TPA: hypothetical protein [Caudoviricetes sp.]